LETLDSKREELLKLSRNLRIESTKAIASVHNGRIEEAERLIENAEKIARKIFEFREHTEIYGIATEALREFVEAIVLLSFATRKNVFDVFDLTQLSLDSAAVLTGFGDAVGELRRYALDSIRRGDIARAEECIEEMEKIYSLLSTFIFPEKLVPGLRPRVDVARRLIEKTKSDLISAKLIERLE